MSILDILNELEDTSSTLEKVAILQREQNNELLKKVFQAAYDPMITYGINKIPEYRPISSSDEGMTLENAILGLDRLASREETGNDAIVHLRYLLSWLEEDDGIVLERIIKRDLRCGTSDTLASRVWPGLVLRFDVMLSHKDISGIKFPAYAQIKSDGARCHMTRKGNKAIAFSRNGKPIELRCSFDSEICHLIKDGETLDGELLAFKDGKALDRKIGNGLVNKAVRGTINDEEANTLVFVSWDIVDFSSTVPYSERITRLTEQYMHVFTNSSDFFNRIRVLKTTIVKSKEESQLFFEQCLDAGEEGAMIKNMNSMWVPKRSKDLGKMKAEEVADLKIVDVIEGSGKYAGMFGAFVFESQCGKLRVNVGTGYSDHQRKDFWTNRSSMLGRVAEVMYNQLITSKGKDTSSLFLPRFMDFRFDKSIANTLEELK